jgi:hypothetical protein
MEGQIIDVDDPQQAVKNTYSKVWGEFYDWETNYVRSALKAVEETRQGYNDGFFGDCIEWSHEGAQRDGDYGADEDYVPVKTIKNDFEPFPPYDYCTPTIYNFNNVWDVSASADEVESQSWIGFVPFTDEDFPSMDEYLENCVCEWESDIWHDPDCEY